jgi:hypothetical protein
MSAASRQNDATDKQHGEPRHVHPLRHNEEAAYGFVEARLWPHGPVCPRCGVVGNSVKLKGKHSDRLQAIFLVASSKKGISSNQLHRALGVTLKSPRVMSHRIREACAESGEAFEKAMRDLLKPKGKK